MLKKAKKETAVKLVAVFKMLIYLSPTTILRYLFSLLLNLLFKNIKNIIRFSYNHFLTTKPF